jgi:hypothetical protein
MSNLPLSPLLQRRNQLILASALLLLLATAVVQGVWTDRWGGGDDLERALARLDQAPLTAEGWRGQSRDLESEQLEQARRVGIAGLSRRQFTRTTDGQKVWTILMGGRFGPLSVHTPDFCYGGAGYVMVGKPIRIELKRESGVVGAFWTARFHKPNSPEVPPLRLFWGWNASDGWKAPANPRWAFRMKPVLYKLYLARELASLDEPLDDDPGAAFLRAWLPELDRALFSD